MKLAVAFVLATGSLARATTFDEYAPGLAARPAAQLYEAACDLDVDLRGAVAVIEMRQKIVNPGATMMAAVYEHELPPGAVVTGFALRSAAGTETALAVPSGFRTAEIDSPDVLGPDPAMLHRLADGRYEIVVQPIAPEHDVTLITRYTVVATPRAGALRVVMPGRTSAGKLNACKGAIRVTPGPGVAVKRVRVAGIEAGKTSAPFAVESTDVALDVDLDVGGSAPVVWAQTQALADGWNASLVTVLAPRVKSAGARRVVVLVDTSRSMELVGRHHVAKVVKALGSALPAGAEVEAIVFDRTATRVFGDVRPATAQNWKLIEDAIARRGAANGSDLVGAFELAHLAIEGARGQAMVIVVTDGVTGELADQALVHALASKTSAVDVHAIVLDPARTRSPGAKALRSPVNLFGGAFVEVNVDELDDAMIAIDEWMRPSWLELALGAHAIPSEVRGGAGFTKLVVHRGPAAFTLEGHGDAPIRIPAKAAPQAPIATLALAGATAESIAGPDPDGPQLEAAGKALAKAIAANPSAEHDRALVVLATTGRIAKNRRAMVVGGGRFERMIALADPPRTTTAPATPAPVPASSIARITLERLFRDQLQPKAYACYQRALGTNTALAGTVHFELRMGRGEVSDVRLIGLGDKALDACLVDAAYAITPPMPDFSVNADDQTLANYPLTFQRRDDRPVVVLGDADSTSPIDIDAVEGGVPVRTKKLKVDTRTPLGGMKPPRSP